MLPGAVRYLAALTVVLGGLLAGCSDGSSSSASTTRAPTTSAPTSAPARPSPVPPTVVPTVAVAPVAGGDYCAAARRFAAVDLAAARQPAALRQAFAELDVVLPAMRAAAPEELRSDLSALAAGYAKVRDAAAADGWQWSTMAGAVMAIGQDAAFTSAGERVDDYDRRTCGVAPAGATSTTSRA